MLAHNPNFMAISMDVSIGLTRKIWLWKRWNRITRHASRFAFGCGENEQLSFLSTHDDTNDSMSRRGNERQRRHSRFRRWILFFFFFFFFGTGNNSECSILEPVFRLTC